MNFDEKLLTLIDKEKNLKDYLISIGFDNLKDQAKLNTFGKLLTLNQLLESKNINKELFLKSYENFTSTDVENEKNIFVKGVVPCPIRVPLLDYLGEFVEEENIHNVDFDLRSANLGTEFFRELLKSDSYEDMPEIITSAGFELFLDKEIMKNIEKYYTAPQFPVGDDLKNRGADLVDPKNRFHILGIVPGVFIINKEQLRGRHAPESWEELLTDDFENSLSIPMGDLDLYNAIVLTIYSKFGEEGLKKLRKCFSKDLHPAQMVLHSENTAAVSIAPYFFASMILNDKLSMVWPREGAIVSPILITFKKDSVRDLNKIEEYLVSQRVGEIFSNRGKFPTTNPSIDNMLPEDKLLLWTGWEILENIDENLELIENYFELGEV